MKNSCESRNVGQADIVNNILGVEHYGDALFAIRTRLNEKFLTQDLISKIIFLH